MCDDMGEQLEVFFFFLKIINSEFGPFLGRPDLAMRGWRIEVRVKADRSEERVPEGGGDDEWE